MLKRIETKEELMQWAKEVNTGNYKYICDYQDIFAHSDEKLLKSLFVGFEKYDKELVAFSISKAMGQEKLFSFMKAWALQQANICIEENEKTLVAEFDKLNNERNAFESHKDGYEKRAKEANEFIDGLTRRNSFQEDIIRDLKKDIAERDEQIERLKEENENMGEYISKATEFRAYLKGILSESNVAV